MASEKSEQKKKRYIVLICIIVLLIAAVAIGIIFTSSERQSTKAKITTEQGGDGKTKKADDIKNQDSEVEEKSNSRATDKTKAVSQPVDIDSKKADNQSTGTSSKPENTSDSGSGNSGTGEKTTSTTPEHTHTWTAVYGTKTVNIPYTVDEEHEICNNCGADITGYTGEHMDDTLHIGGFHSKYIQVTKYRTETQKYIKYYQCSCGKTK